MVHLSALRSCPFATTNNMAIYYPAEFFHGAFKVGGTKSWRLAGCKFLSSDEEDGYGSNPQNVPDEVRRIFVPRFPDWSFVQCDLEGAEAVAVALLVGEGQFRDLIRLKIKPHCFLCVHLFPNLFADLLGPDFDYFNLTPRVLAEHKNFKAIIKRTKALKREYDLAKRTVHGFNYGMAWRTHQESTLKGTNGAVVLSPAEAKRQLETPARLFPEIKAMQIAVEEAIKNHQPLYNLFGEMALFIARYSGSLARTAISWRPQSTVGQCTNRAFVKLQKQIEEEGRIWNILNPVHDSILGECPDSEVFDLINAMRSAMTFTFKSPIDGWEATIGVEAQVGKNWGKWSEENPNGLKVV